MESEINCWVIFLDTGPARLERNGKPFAIRVANGPEYVSGKLMEWAEK